MVQLNPKEMVLELDKYVVGQEEAKKIIAVAFRNRYRRLMLDDEQLKEDIVPKNVLLIGSTGVGKTEIVRRASQICNAPFIKVEATRFTEVGYVGKDVESIIRDLTDKAVAKSKNEERKKCEIEVQARVKAAILKILYKKYAKDDTILKSEVRKDFESGKFDTNIIEIEVKDEQNTSMQDLDLPSAPMGMHMSIMSVSDLFRSEKPVKVKKTVKEAISLLTREYADDMVDEKALIKKTLKNVEESGVVFIDEIDKVISGKESGGRGDISREGVQRDLLPLIEGASIQTKHGYVETRHILFIGCGAFYQNKPSDLLPELQGRFPIRANLKNLTDKDFYKILTSTQNNLIIQYVKMMEVDNLEIKFTDDALLKIAEITFELNQANDNIGARRLHTVIEKVLEEILYEHPKSSKKPEKIDIDEKFVLSRLGAELEKKMQYSKFIL